VPREKRAKKGTYKAPSRARECGQAEEDKSKRKSPGSEKLGIDVLHGKHQRIQERRISKKSGKVPQKEETAKTGGIVKGNVVLKKLKTDLKGGGRGEKEKERRAKKKIEGLTIFCYPKKKDSEKKAKVDANSVKNF